MKSAKDRAFLVSLGIAVVIGLLFYFIMIAPKRSSIAKELKSIENNMSGQLSVKGVDTREFKVLLASYSEQNAKLIKLRADLLSEVSFEMPPDFDAGGSTPPEVLFPITKSRIVASLRDSYPGFPFVSSLGFPDLPDVGKEEYQQLFVKLAVSRRLLIIFGEAGVNSVRSFSHPTSTEVRNEAAKATMIRNKVSVTFEGTLKTIVESLKQLSSNGKYLYIEDMSVHASASGYSLECNLTVSVLSVEFDVEETYSAPPDDNNPPKSTPATAVVTPTKRVPPPEKTSTSAVTPTRTRSNPAGW